MFFFFFFRAGRVLETNRSSSELDAIREISPSGDGRLKPVWRKENPPQQSSRRVCVVERDKGPDFGKGNRAEDWLLISASREVCGCTHVIADHAHVPTPVKEKLVVPELQRCTNIRER